MLSAAGIQSARCDIADMNVFVLSVLLGAEILVEQPMSTEMLPKRDSIRSQKQSVAFISYTSNIRKTQEPAIIAQLRMTKGHVPLIATRFWNAIGIVWNMRLGALQRTGGQSST